LRYYSLFCKKTEVRGSDENPEKQAAGHVGEKGLYPAFLRHFHHLAAAKTISCDGGLRDI
jgi:hypothetical protein